MEENKNEQYTFAPEEKEILEKMNLVEASVKEQNIQNKNQRELIATKYYSEFVVNTEKGPITLKNVFITSEMDQQGKVSYHFRWINENDNGEQVIEECLSIDADGKVHAIGDLADYLGEELDIEEFVKSNDLEKGRLKGISEKSRPEEKQENEEVKEINKEMKKQGQDLELTNIRPIKDVQNIKERIPGVFDNSEEQAQAYSNKLGKFVIIEKVQNDDKVTWQLNEDIQPAQPTMKTIISIDEDGDKIERKVPHALMKTNRSDKEMAVTYGPYGTVNVQTVDVLPCQERVARQVREQGEGIDGQEDAQVRREFSAGGKEYTHDFAHQIEEIEDVKKENDQKPQYQITENDYSPNTETTWKELMEETGERLPELVERYNRDMAKNEGQADSKSVVQDIIDDYQMVSHERTSH